MFRFREGGVWYPVAAALAGGVLALRHVADAVVAAAAVLSARREDHIHVCIAKYISLPFHLLLASATP